MKTFLTLILMLVLTAWSASAANLIRNSSFECGNSGWSWGDGSSIGVFEHNALTTTNSPYHGTRWYHSESAGMTGDYKNQVITSMYYRLKPSTDYTMTCWIKKAGTYNYVITVKNVTVSDDHTVVPTLSAGATARYTNTFTTLSGSNTTYLIWLNAGGQGSPGAWADLDAVQLEEGSVASDYAPINPIEFGFENSVSNVGNVFYSTDVPALPVIFYNNTANSSNVTLAYRVLNGLNQMVKSGTNSVTSISGRSTNYLDISLTTNQLGSFRTLAWMVGQSNSFVETVSSTVMAEPGLSEAASRFGTHPSFYADYLTPIKKLGFKYVRSLSPSHIFAFAYVEPTSNSFVWHDTEISTATNLGLVVVATTGQGRSVAANDYIPDIPAWADDGSTNGYGGAGMPRIFDWNYLLTNMVSHYSNSVHVWEIWNEPEREGGFYYTGSIQRYAEMMTNASATIRAIQPNAVILGFVTAYSNYMWSVSQFMADQSSFDVVATHLYPEIGDDFINRNTALATSWNKPQWNTEQGGRIDPFHQSIWWEDDYQDVDQPYATRDYRIRGSWPVWDFVETSTLGAGGIVKNFYYDARATASFGGNIINYSFFGHDHTIKPLGVFISTLARFADGSTNGPLWRPGNGVSGRVFAMRDGTSSLLICYNYSGNAGGNPAQLNWLKSTRPSFSVYDAYGNAITYNNGVSFAQTPIYLVAANTATNDLLTSLTCATILDTNAPAVSFTLWPTATEGGWVKWFAQDDVDIVPRNPAASTNELRYAYNTGSGWSGWSRTNAIQVATGAQTITVAAKDIAGNASTNIIYLGGASPTTTTTTFNIGTLRIR